MTTTSKHDNYKCLQNYKSDRQTRHHCLCELNGYSTSKYTHIYIYMYIYTDRKSSNFSYIRIVSYEYEIETQDNVL